MRANWRAHLPLPRSAAWRTLCHFERIVCLDHFHRSADLDGRPPAAGLEFDLPHRIGPWTIARRGRILLWREGRSYVFSDLARGRRRRAFPHVFVVALDDASRPAGGCRLRLEVRGRWTTNWLPGELTRAWIGWNLAAMGQRIRNAILADALRAGVRLSRGEAGCSADRSAAPAPAPPPC
ncbi:MAG: hypothetical protein R3325_07740 [Thermoanaerobaculia bacterium]|nr:hypothetical protein [Thermoanaerobaculia bacterium]